MNESMLGKNYLLGAKISFLIMSFVIVIIGAMVQNDIWPFLQTTLPAQKDSKLWFISAIIIGLILPSICLVRDWPNKAVRYSLMSIIIMIILQILTEYLVANYFFISLVVPTAILYVGYRIIQLVNLQRVLNKTSLPSNRSKTIRALMVGLNLIFWSILWIKLTFFIFPQIIYQIF